MQQVYKDPSHSSDSMLQGIKGQTYLEPGWVYAPAIPLQVTPLIRLMNYRVYNAAKLARLKIKRGR